MIYSMASSNFYPRPPRGGRLVEIIIPQIVQKISIHALREEGDENNTNHTGKKAFISIHALREEGDKLEEVHGL